MTRKIKTKGGLEWIGCRARSVSALVRDLREPKDADEYLIHTDLMAASLLMERAARRLEDALGVSNA